MPDSSSPTLPILTSIELLARSREAWLTDIWGVIHNGIEPFAPACDACTRFRLAGGIVVLLSNAPRPHASVAAQLDRIGVPRFSWDAIVTSGDVARSLLEAWRGRQIYHLGPERDLPLYDGLDVSLTPEAAAEAVSCTGLFDDEVETPDDYAELLRSLAARNLPMVCANPDLTVERGSKIVFCAGALAQVYEKLGGMVQYAGKPYAPIYDITFRAIEKLRGREVGKKAMLAIGDGLATDIAGAAGAGIEFIFIVSGVHVAGDIDDAAVSKLFAKVSQRPIAVMPALAW